MELPPCDKYQPESTHADQRQGTAPLPQAAAEIWLDTHTGFLRFPFSNFRYSLTLFSKFFASFPHGTCTLSVSHRYLALDGIYHLIWAAIPSNSTHWGNILWHINLRQEREFHPLSCPLPRDLVQNDGRCNLSRPQFGAKAQIHMVSSSRFTRRY